MQTMIYEREGSLVRPSYTGISAPQLYNLKSDPKEKYNLTGENGATPILTHLLKLAGNVMANFKEYPYMDYSKMKRNN